MRSEVSKTCDLRSAGDLYGEKLEKRYGSYAIFHGEIYRKAGNEDCGNDFPDMLQADRALNLQKFQNYTDKTAKLFIKLLQNTGEI